LKLNCTYQLLVCTDNILYEGIYTIKKNAEALVDTSKETGLEVSAEKTMYMGTS
jgi:hypothetical protein